ncbi:MAG: hypothetical protein ABSE19_12510 [Candidatus Acidiferrum sp.]
MDIQLELASKIERLRKQIFWTRCIAGAALLCLAVAVTANWKRTREVVEAKEIILKDGAGNVAARLGQDNLGNTCLTLNAKAHIAVASLCVQDGEGSSLDLHNLKSQSRATLTPGFYLYEPHEHLQPALIINESASTNFANLNVGAEVKLTMGHNSKDSVRLSSPAGEPRITPLGANENPVWSTR